MYQWKKDLNTLSFLVCMQLTKQNAVPISLGRVGVCLLVSVNTCYSDDPSSNPPNSFYVIWKYETVALYAGLLLKGHDGDGLADRQHALLLLRWSEFESRWSLQCYSAKLI